MNSEKAWARLVITALLVTCSCGSLRELATLRKCDFRLSGLEHFVVAGIRMDGIDSYADLNFIQLGILASGMAKGDLPMDFTADIEVLNPNPAPASLNKLEYIAFIDDVRIAEGYLDKRVDIPPSGGSAVIPLAVSVNLAAMFRKESLNALFNLVLNLSDAGGKPTRFSLKIRPTISVAGREIVYPGYIRISAEFSQDV